KQKRMQNGRPYKSDTKGQWQKTIEKSIENYLDSGTKIEEFKTGADARILANVGEMSTIILGPGSIRQAHTVNEFVEIEEYLQSISLLSYIITNWTNTRV